MCLSPIHMLVTYDLDKKGQANLNAPSYDATRLKQQVHKHSSHCSQFEHTHTHSTYTHTCTFNNENESTPSVMLS